MLSGFSKIHFCQRPFRSLLAAINAMWDPHSVEGVAGELETVLPGQVVFNPINTLFVA